MDTDIKEMATAKAMAAMERKVPLLR